MVPPPKLGLFRQRPDWLKWTLAVKIDREKLQQRFTNKRRSRNRKTIFCFFTAKKTVAAFVPPYMFHFPLSTFPSSRLEEFLCPQNFPTLIFIRFTLSTQYWLGKMSRARSALLPKTLRIKRGFPSKIWSKIHIFSSHWIDWDLKSFPL